MLEMTDMYIYMINYVIRQQTLKEILNLINPLDLFGFLNPHDPATYDPLPTLPRKTKKKVQIWKRDA